MLFDVRYKSGGPSQTFAVSAVDVLEEWPLAARSGPYQGLWALSFKNGTLEGLTADQSVFKIRVNGPGAWEVRVGLPDFSAPKITSATGSGDQVIGPFSLIGGADFRFEVSHTGAKFHARLIADDGTAQYLGAQETGSFSAKIRPVNVGPRFDLPNGNYVLAIIADGAWTVRLLD